MATQGHATVDLTHEVVRLDAVGTGTQWLGLALGIAGGGVALGATVLSKSTDAWTVFFRAYLLNYTFVLSLALGALFFVMIQHLTRAGWSAALRRVAELTAATMPVLAVFFLPLLIPVVFAMGGVYEWADPHHVMEDALLKKKAPYLNMPFFIVRCAFYFAVWVLLAWRLLHLSLAQDETGAALLTLRMERLSAGGMILFALTLTFFAIDVLMSLNPHWFSTIWGVYFFAGSAVGFFALLAIVLSGLQNSGRLRQAVSIEHYHDVGKFAFGFVVFWAYIAFSQYMLIWYANIPEETVWFQARQGSPWWIGISLVLLFGHFLAPFLALLSRHPKRRPGILVGVAVWLLLMHWLDLYYIVIPRVPRSIEGLLDVSNTPSGFAVADIALLFGLGGVFAFALLRSLRRHSLLAQRDPWLHESLTFENI